MEIWQENPFLDQPDQTEKPADNWTTPLDVGKEAAAGVADLAAKPFSAMQGAAAADPNMPETYKFGQSMSMLLHGAGEDIRSTLTPGGKRSLESTVVPEEGKDSALSRPVGAFAMKSAGMLPYALMFGMFPESTLAMAAGGAGTQVLDNLDSAVSTINKLDDHELAQQSPTFSKMVYDDGIDPAEARKKLVATVSNPDVRDTVAAGLVGAAGFGLIGKVVKKGVSGATWQGRLAAGGGEMGVGLGAMGAQSDIAQQHAEQAMGARAQVDWHQTALHGLNAALEGSVLGGFTGVLHKSPDGRRQREDTTPTVEQTDARAPDSAQSAAIAANAPQDAARPELPAGPVDAGPGPGVDIPAYKPTVEPRPEPVSEPTPTPEPLAATAANQEVVPPRLPPEARPAEAVTPEPVVQSPSAAAPVPIPVPRETPTVPETAATLVEQRKQLIDGTRKVQMFPEGTQTLPTPEGMKRLKVKGDVFDYNPKLIKPKDIRAAHIQGRLNDILDLGPLSKDDVLQRAATGESPVAVTERTPDGTEVKASAATAPTADIQAAHLEATKTPGNTIQAEHPADVLAGRVAPEAPDSAEALARKIAGRRVLKTEGEDEGWSKLPGVAEEEAKAAEPPKEEKKPVGTGTGGNRSAAQKEQRAKNADIAKRIFEATPPATLPTDKTQRAAFKTELGTRLRSQIDQALADGVMKEHPTTKKLEPGIQGRIGYENASPHSVWLAEANRVLAKIEKKTVKYDEIEQLLASEHALRAGDDKVLREARKAGGEAYGEARRKEAAPRETEKGGEPEEASARVRETGESPEDRLLREETEREAGLTEAEPALPVREREPVVTKEGEGYTAVKPREGFAVERRRARMPEKVREKVELARKPDIVAHEEATQQTAKDFLEWKRQQRAARVQLPGTDGAHFAEGPAVPFGRFIREHAGLHGGYQGVFESGLNRVVGSQFQRAIARLAHDTPVYVISPRTMASVAKASYRGFHDYGNKYIALRSDIFDKSKNPVEAHATILHEGVHAALDRLVDNNMHARALVTDMASYVKNYIEQRAKLTQLPHEVRYAFDTYNNDPRFYHKYREFMTQASSNGTFQQVLAEIPAPAKLIERLGMNQQRPMNMWQLFVNAARRWLGLPKGQHTMLEAVMHATEQLGDLAAREHGASPRDIVRTPEGRRVIAAHEDTEGTTREAVTDFVKNKASGAIENITTKPVERVVNTAINVMTDVGTDVGKFGRFFEATNQYVERSMKYFPGEREQNVLRKIHDTIERMGVVARKHQVMGTQLLGEMYYLSKKLPAAFDRFSKLINDSTMYGIDPSARIGEGRNGYLELNKEVQAKLARGAKLNDLIEQGKVNKSHIEAHDNYERLRKEYEDLNRIDPRFGEYMERSFQAFEKHQREATRLHLQNILRVHYDGASEHVVKARADEMLNAKMTDDYKQYLIDTFGKGDEAHGKLVADQITQAKSLSGKNGVYAPLMRHGNYVVHGEYKLETPTNAKAIGDRGDTFEFANEKDAIHFARESGLHYNIDSAYYDPTTGEKTTKSGGLSTTGTPDQRWQVQVNRKHVEFAERLSEAKRRHEELSATGHVNMRPVEEREQFFRSEHELTSQGVQSILKRQEQTRAYQQATPEGRQQMRRAVQEASIMMQAGNRVQSRRLPRRRVEGASDDFLHNFDIYNKQISNYRAKLEYRPQVEAALQEMRDQANERSRNNYGKADDGLKRSKIVNEMNKRAHAEDPNDYTGKWAAISRKLSTWSYIYRMGRISHLFLHQAHLPMITTPIIAGRHFARAPIEVARMFSQMAGKNYKAGIKDAWTSAVVNGFHQGTDYMGVAQKVFGHLPDGKRLMEAYQRMVDIGYMHPQYEVEVSRHLPNQQSKIPVFRQADYLINRFDTVFRHVTNASEMLNRMVGFGAAYRLEFAKLTREGMKEHDAHEHAVEYARNILANTEGVYSTTNAAPIFKTWARPFLQFRQFPQMMYNLMGKTLVKALGKDATMQERIQNASSLGLLLATHGAMTGVLGGLPLESAKIMATVTHGLGITSGDWGDVERWEYEKAVQWFGKDMAPLIMHGLSRQMGIDAHHRLGLNSFFTFGMPEGNEVNQKGMSAFFFNQMAGAPVGLVQDFTKGIGKMLDGDIGGGAAQLSPQFIRDISKMWNSGGPMFKYTTPGEHIARGLGFTPSKEAEYFERRAETKAQSESYKAERQKLTYKWVDAAPGDKSKAWAAIQKWNQGRDPDSKITMDQLTKAAKNKKKTEKDLVSGVRLNKQTKFIGDRANAIY